MSSVVYREFCEFCGIHVNRRLTPIACFGKPRAASYAMRGSVCGATVVSNYGYMYPQSETNVQLHIGKHTAYETDVRLPMHAAGNRPRIVKWNRDWATHDRRTSSLRSPSYTKGSESLTYAFIDHTFRSVAV